MKNIFVPLLLFASSTLTMFGADRVPLYFDDVFNVSREITGTDNVAINGLSFSDGTSLTTSIWTSSAGDVYTFVESGVGINLSNPTSAFHVSGTSRFTNTMTLATANIVMSNGQIQSNSSGTASDPSLAFSGDTDTGIFRNAANEIGFSVGGTTNMVLDSSGNLGVGSSINPLNKFNVSNDGSTKTLFDSNEYFQLHGGINSYGTVSNDTITVGLGVFDSGGDGNFGTAFEGGFLGTLNNAPFTIRTNNANRIRVEGGGNVGINDTSPAAIVEINGGNASLDTFMVTSGGGSDGDWLLVNGSGNIGIGATTVDGRVHILTDSASASAPHVNADDFIIENATNPVGMSIIGPDGGQTSRLEIGSESNPSHISMLYSKDSNFFSISKNGTVAMSFFDQGNVGIRDLEPDAHFEISKRGQSTTPVFMVSSNDNNDGDIFIIDENGNIGINDSTPESPLQISNSVSFTSGDIDINLDSINVTTNNTIFNSDVDINSANLNMTNQAVVSLDDGTASQPGLNFLSDPDSGLMRLSANRLAMTTAATATMVWDETNRVGFASADRPQHQIHIHRNATNGNTALQITNDDTGNSTGSDGFLMNLNLFERIVLDNQDGGEFFLFVAGNSIFRMSTSVTAFNDTQQNMNFRWESTTNNQAMFFDGDRGSLGFSEVSPEALLEISLDGTTTNEAFMVSANDNGDGDIFIIDENGDIGIGDSSPDAPLDVSVAASFTSNVSMDSALVVGNPTGGFDNGTGSINAEAVYDDNALLADYVFDKYFDGKVSVEDQKRHSNYVMYNIDEMEEFVKVNRHLPAMPSRSQWKQRKASIGELQTALWQTQEEQMLYIIELNNRIKALEEKCAN